MILLNINSYYQDRLRHDRYVKDIFLNDNQII